MLHAEWVKARCEFLCASPLQVTRYHRDASQKQQNKKKSSASRKTWVCFRSKSGHSLTHHTDLKHPDSPQDAVCANDNSGLTFRLILLRVDELKKIISHAKIFWISLPIGRRRDYKNHPVFKERPGPGVPKAPHCYVQVRAIHLQ